MKPTCSSFANSILSYFLVFYFIFSVFQDLDKSSLFERMAFINLKYVIDQSDPISITNSAPAF